MQLSSQLPLSVPKALFQALVASLVTLLCMTSADVASGGNTVPPCEDGNCFAVFVMPDTQHYVSDFWNSAASPHNQTFEGDAKLHLIRTMEWICANRSSYVEASTGKTMNIELLLHLGDLVASNAKTYVENFGGATCNSNDCEWNEIDQVFSVLDDCPPGPGPDGILGNADDSTGPVRYLVAPGNHDWDIGSGNPFSPFGTTDRFDEFFPEGDVGSGIPGRAPWVPPYRCDGLDVASCDWSVGEWYLGGGDDAVDEALGGNGIPEDSRGAEQGPMTAQRGRHRTGMIRAPNGDPFLFLGLEFTSGLPYSKAWPKALLAANPGVPAVLFNHQGIFNNLLTDDLVDPHSQVFLFMNGHAWPNSNRVHSVSIGSAAYSVPFLQRNWQNYAYGRGWNVIAVFDADRGEVRVRSVQINGDHIAIGGGGDIVNVGIVDYDLLNTSPLGQMPELPVALPDLPRFETDNCQNARNPGQIDTDGDLVGDVCDLCVLMPDPGQEDTDGNGVGDACNDFEDADGDDWADVLDNCPNHPNDDQQDSDGDGHGDECDFCRVVADPNQEDQDFDGVGDACDNCLSVANGPLLSTGACIDQLDGDRDGYGNPCDTDLNNNGAADLADVNQVFAAAQIVSTDPNFDLNCNGAADLADVWNVFLAAAAVAVPGPSSLPCAGTIGCFDTDQDGAFDFEDNCSELPNGPVVGTDNCFDQEDADLDGYGNACDTDINGNGATDLVDWFATMNAFDAGSLDPIFDFNCNGAVDLVDLSRSQQDTQAVKPVGPSGLACAGTIPCTAP